MRTKTSPSDSSFAVCATQSAVTGALLTSIRCILRSSLRFRTKEAIWPPSSEPGRPSYRQYPVTSGRQCNFDLSADRWSLMEKRLPFRGHCYIVHTWKLKHFTAVGPCWRERGWAHLSGRCRDNAASFYDAPSFLDPRNKHKSRPVKRWMPSDPNTDQIVESKKLREFSMCL